MTRLLRTRGIMTLSSDVFRLLFARAVADEDYRSRGSRIDEIYPNKMIWRVFSSYKVAFWLFVYVLRGCFHVGLYVKLWPSVAFESSCFVVGDCTSSYGPFNFPIVFVFIRGLHVKPWPPLASNRSCFTFGLVRRVMAVSSFQVFLLLVKACTSSYGRC